MSPQRIELHVRSIEQLFNPLDHSPLAERDLDAEAEQYIVGTARELDARQRAPSWQSASTVLTEAAEVLGLTQTLKMPAPELA